MRKMREAGVRKMREAGEKQLCIHTECRGFESHPGQLFFSLEKKAVLGVVDLIVVPLPFYLVVDNMHV